MFRETMKKEPAKVGVVIKSLVLSYLLTALLLLILALMVFKMNLKQEGVETDYIYRICIFWRVHCR